MIDLQTDLDTLESQSMRRHLRIASEAKGKTLVLDGKSVVNFASNNYLGLARHPQVIEAAKQVLDHWGVGSTSSRLIAGSSIIHQDLESALAAYTGHEAALLFPAGYQANLGVVTSLVGEGDAVILDRLCHASLVDAARLSGARLFVYPHRDLEAAHAALERTASYRRRLVLTESLFSMDGDFAPAAELAVLARQHQAMLLVDEAHALGVWDLCTGADITVGTLSKALGSQGGFVAGSRALIETLVNRARSFIFTTGLSPVCVAAGFAALSVAQDETSRRLKVLKLSTRLRDGLRAAGWETLGSESQIVPILLGTPEEALRVAQALLDAGIFAPAIRPPTVHAGECRIRFSVTSDLDESDIDLLLKVLAVPSPAGRG